MLVMYAYSVDLRQRIIDSLSSGATIAQTAERFAVGPSTVKRYQARLKTTGTLTATPLPGRVPHITPAQHDALRTLVASRTDWTLSMLTDAWHKQTGALVTIRVLSDTLHRLKITYYKKRAASPPSATPTSGPPSESK